VTSTATDRTSSTVPPDGLRFAAAGVFLEALAAQDFARLGSVIRADAQLQALVPRGLREWQGREQICSAFAGWFGDTDDCQLVEAVIGDVGVRLHMHWRARLRAPRLGPGWFVVEQQVYADTDGRGRIAKLRLLCSGYCPEP
jgi:hypothetical protein